MGGAIAWLMSDRDIPVTMVDLEWDFVRKGFQSAKGIYDELKAAGRIDERHVGLKMLKISGSTDYGHLAGKDLVVEAIVERLDVKRRPSRAPRRPSASRRYSPRTRRRSPYPRWRPR